MVLTDLTQRVRRGLFECGLGESGVDSSQDLLHTVITAVCHKDVAHVCSIWGQTFCNYRANAE